MKIIVPLFAAFLIGCSTGFKSRLDEAERQYAKKNYIAAVDSINLGLPRWKESDGKKAKGRAYELLGLSYHAINKIGKATESYEKALENSDQVFDAAYNLGFIYLTERKPNKAVVTFQRALRIRKDDPSALLGLGNAYFAVKNYRRAKQQYNRLLDVSPGVRDALKYLSITNKKLRRSRRRR